MNSQRWAGPRSAGAVALWVGTLFLSTLFLVAPAATAAETGPESTPAGSDHTAAVEQGTGGSVASAGTEATETGADHTAGVTDEGAPDHGEESHIGETLPLWSVLPFAGILLSIALFPLLAPRFWHHHYPKVSLAWALLFALPFLIGYGSEARHEILHIYLIDYFPFIILLWGLFTVAGGIVVRGDLTPTPAVNTTLLAIGTGIASFVGTTGAAMLLIRPVLRANEERRRKVHTIVFFIFLVANIGGCLTPLGDPPLFLGFLHGVPFSWTFNLFPHMLVAAGSLLVIYYFLDRRLYREERQLHAKIERERAARRQVAEGKEPDIEVPHREPVSVAGLVNLLFLGGIIGSVLLSGVWKAGAVSVLGVEMELQDLVRDVAILLMGFFSLSFTSATLRKDNGFTWEPIREVAYLFAGIFMTIIPALAILKAGEAGHFGFLIAAVRKPWHYFWVTGVLSSFLDNAPTYLTFFNTALGNFFHGIPEAEAVHMLIAENKVFLEAIAAGAVFMGANTYIGNAPNFMVKSIAEERGVAMPSFFGYLLRWSMPILLPLFIIITLIFFR